MLGQIDSVRIYDEALPASLLDSGSGGGGPESGIPTAAALGLLAAGFLMARCSSPLRNKS